MGKLNQKKCVPCIHGGNSLKLAEVKKLHAELGESWKVLQEKFLEKEFSFKNFKEAWDFLNAIAHLAEDECHHPEMVLAWGKLKIKLWTHAVNGLCENDFIMAAKIDALYISRLSVCE